MSEETSASEQPSRANWPLIIIGCAITYVLSSGPVLATSFWLREATGWDEFNSVVWLYYPLLVSESNDLMIAYIEWWLEDAFITVDPG